jgi:hypothetical protein
VRPALQRAAERVVGEGGQVVAPDRPQGLQHILVEGQGDATLRLPSSYSAVGLGAHERRTSAVLDVQDCGGAPFAHAIR